MNHSHYIVPLLSPLWWQGLVFSILFIVVSLLLGKKLTEKGKKRFGQLLGLLFLFFAIGIHFYEWREGIWNYQVSLPLQLCALSGILSGLVFFWPNQKAYELLVFWGIPGALHSLLTPEMSHGKSDFFVVDYYVSHAGIILAALYLPMVLHRPIRRLSWLHAFLFTMGLLVFVGAINNALNANYMYLCKKPMADNPMVIGEWPYYIGVLLAVGLIHFLLVYYIYKKCGWVKPDH